MCGLVLLASAVAAVSAYEAHAINVTARVSNSMSLEGVGAGPKYEKDWGTVHPQDFLKFSFIVTYSTSFSQQNRVKKIDYAVYANPKDPVATGVLWGGDCMYVKVMDNPTTDPGNLNPITGWFRIDTSAPVPTDYYGNHPLPGPATAFGPLATGMLDKTPKPGIEPPTPTNDKDAVWVVMDAPTFAGYPLRTTTPPSGLPGPTLTIVQGDTARYKPAGVDLGVDIDIQVTGIHN